MQHIFEAPTKPGPKRSFLYRTVTHLTFYVLLAILAGVLLGHYDPGTAVQVKPLGNYFILVIKFFIVPIIFLTISLGIGAMGDLKKVGWIGLKSLIYFELVTTFSLVMGVGLALLLKPGHIDKDTLHKSDASKEIAKVDHKAGLWELLVNNMTLVVLVLAIVAGIVFIYHKRRTAIIAFLERSSKVVFTALKYVMYLAPLGAFGGMAYIVGKFGLASLLPLGKLVGSVYLTMALFVSIILGAILRYYKLSIFKFVAYLQEELLVVLGTSSSEPAMPGLIQKLEKLGCEKSVVGLVVPTGYSFNLDGTSIYLSMATIFLAQLYDIHLSWSQLGLIIGVLMITSKGAAGVTGSGFVVLASTLSSLGTIPLEGLAFLLGIDKFMSEARAITNIIGNGVATLVIARSENEMDMEAAHPIAMDAT